MKFAINGALTIGTLDGANVEIREEVGAENFFLFGLTADEVAADARPKATPRASSTELNRRAARSARLDRLSGEFSHGDRELFAPAGRLACSTSDEYLLLADYRPTSTARTGSAPPSATQDAWTQMSILNVARMGKFSSDRAIREYCRDIWKTWPVKIEL